MSSFLATFIPAIALFALGVFIAWFIWGRDSSDNA
jgi:Sec-independent protein secretion pathway component TatC